LGFISKFAVAKSQVIFFQKNEHYWPIVKAGTVATGSINDKKSPDTFSGIRARVNLI
jgi:hypothetical protein